MRFMMFLRRTVCLGSFIGLLAAVVAGCADPYAGRKEINGNVKLEGQPLEKGQIYFISLEGNGSDSGVQIAEGEYRMSREHGLKPGKYLVQLTSGDGKTPTEAEAGAPGGSTNIVSMDRI